MLSNFNPKSNPLGSSGTDRTQHMHIALSGTASDKERLFSKLKEENSFLVELCEKKSTQLAKMLERKLQLEEKIRVSEEAARLKTIKLQRVAEGISEAQKAYVGSQF